MPAAAVHDVYMTNVTTDKHLCPELPKTDDVFELSAGTGVTTCCGTFVTYHDDDLCCKSCWEIVE